VRRCFASAVFLRRFLGWLADCRFFAGHLIYAASSVLDEWVCDPLYFPIDQTAKQAAAGQKLSNYRF
jgi:hypothetical protein